MMKFLTSTLLSIFFIGQIFAQQTISGKVSGEDDVIGLEGVAIQVNGQTVGSTDYEGAFTINLPEANANVSFVLSGYETISIQYTGQSSLNVTMVEAGEDGGGEQVLSVGYGTQTKEEITGSIAQIESEGLGSQPVVTLEQANQGRASGVLVQNTGGELGAAASVRIRGGSSLTASNSPLYVVDGVPLTSGNQSDINPNNIASIEVLKDASAASIYGSRAANGVIIITTKSGSAGKMKIDADYQFGVGQTPQKLDLFDGTESRILIIEGILRLSSLDAQITRENLEMWEAQESNVITLPGFGTITLPGFYDSSVYNTDWQDEVFRTASSHRANLSLSGGSKNTTYFGGVSYLTQEGILVGNDFERFNAQLSVNSNISSNLKLNFSASYARTINNRLNDDNDLGNPVGAIVLPASDFYDPDDDYELFVNKLLYNPLTEINFSDNLQTGNVLVGSLGLNYKINENFKITVDGGVDILDDRYERRQGPETLDGTPTGLSRLTETNIFNYLINGYLTYQTDFGSNNNLNVVAGSSYQKSTSDVLFKSARINSIDDLEQLDEGSTSLLNNPVPGSASAFVSYFSRVNLTLDDKYIFQLSGRADGSSRFGEENRYGFFPAISAGWNIGNEEFLINVPSLNYLKLKGSFGLIGNTPDGDFLYQANYFIVNYLGEDGLRGENLSNPSLKWETTQQTDVGLEFGFFGNRLSGEFGYYVKNTSDLLFPRPISQVSGFSSVIDNVAEMRNSGWELTLSGVNVRNDQFIWTTDFNITNNVNEVQDLGGENLIVGVSAFLEGEAAASFYMPVYRGVDPATGAALYDNGNGGTTTAYDEAFENGRQVVGNPNPEFFGGISNTLVYRDFELSFLFQYVLGVDIYNSTGEFLANSGFQGGGQRQDQVNRWYEVGDIAPFPVHDITEFNTNPSTRWLEDGSYIRLNNVSLTYNFPAVLTNRWNLRRLSIFVGGQNLLTFSDYLGYDPDVNSVDPFSGTIGQNILRGIDNFTAPQARTFTTGIKIGF